jgi:hypothetical protein
MSISIVLGIQAGDQTFTFMGVHCGDAGLAMAIILMLLSACPTAGNCCRQLPCPKVAFSGPNSE